MNYERSEGAALGGRVGRIPEDRCETADSSGIFQKAICRGSSAPAARRRPHCGVTKASSILLRLPD